MAIKRPLTAFPWTYFGSRTGHLVGDSLARTVLMLILMSAAVLGLAFAINPQWDLALTRGFYDPATHQFLLTFNPTISWLRDQAVFVTIVCMACLVTSVALKLMMPGRRMLVPGRAVIFLLLTFALGPGLLVNGILKEYWSRPRPAEVVAFGGDKPFMPWWDPRGGCDQNCSFVSGETSTATWTLAPAMLIPGPLGAVAVGAAVIFTIGMGVMRFVVGGHFFTDIAFAVLFTALLIWIVHGLIYRWPRTALDEEKLERGITAVGLFIRNDMMDFLHRGATAVARLLRCRVSDTLRVMRRLTGQSKASGLEPLGIDPELIARVQDLREAYLGAPEARIVAEALDFFIADRIRAEPEVRRRYEEARKRRLGLSDRPMWLVATDKKVTDQPDDSAEETRIVNLGTPGSEAS